MSIKLIDFKDLVDSILEELKIQSSDTVSIQRIKRSINEVYINEVVPHARWKWLENHTKVRFNAAYSSGTAEVTPSSATVTLDPAPSSSLGSFANQYFSVAGHTEVYIIEAHTAGSATLTLTSQFLGVFNETAPFKVWTDKVALPADCRETVTVWHNMYSRPMDAMGWQKFRELTINNPKLEGYPRVYYTGDFVGDLDATRYRELRIHPAIHNVPVTVSVDYVRDVVELTNDGDEPVIPMEDRLVLKYGALAWAWRALMRNPEEANTNYQLFKQKLERMAGKIEDSHDKPQLTVDSLYMKRRRAPKYKIGTQVFENGSGGSTNSTSSTFLQDPIIQGGRITAAVLVDTGVTVDGVDISVLAQDFADHLTDSIDAHDASSISNVPAGNLAATDVQTALNELQSDVDSRALDSALSAHIADTSDAHAASAITNTPSGNLAATTVQAALDEIQTDVDTRATSSALSTHEADTTSIHGIADTADLLTTTNTKVVTNKDIDGGTASNTSRITVPKASKATLDALTRKEATVVYASDTDKLYYDDGSILKLVGSGSGSGINFITDGDAEASNIFSQYNDSSTTRPVDGTGGTATNLSSAVSSTSPLDGTQSFILTKSGSASTQGMGWSVATTTIGTAYKAKVLQIEFDYLVNSGTFVAGSSSAESDVIVYLYDVTNSTLIEPSSIKLLSNSTTISDKFVANFQTSATGSQYRLILHCQSSSTADYSLKLDNIVIRPCNYVYGTSITDWVSYTPTFTGFGTAANVNFTSRSVGDTLEVMGTFTTGTVTATEARISLGYGGRDGGVTTKSTLPTLAYAGAIKTNNSESATDFQDRQVLIEASKAYMTFAASYSTYGVGLSKANGNGLTTTGAILSLKAEFPVEGWSSSVQQSDGYDGRLIAARYTGAPSGTPAGTHTTVTYPTKDFDTTNSYSAGTYTVPSSGIYDITATIEIAGTEALGSVANVAVYVDGSVSLFGMSPRAPGAVANTISIVSGLVELRAGQAVTIRVYTDIGSPSFTASDSTPSFSIHKIQAPTTISATELVALSVNGSTTTAAGAATTISWLNKTTDTHNNFASNEYTIEYPGWYIVDLHVRHNGGAGLAVNQASLCYIQTNVAGAGYTTVRQGFKYVESTGVASFNCNAHYEDYLLAGTKIRFQHETTLGTPTIGTSGTDTYASIVRK